MKCKWVICFGIGMIVLIRGAVAQPIPVPNGSFEEGVENPSHWTSSGGNAAWITGAAGGRAIAVTGTGQPGDSNYWRSETLPLKPNTVYRLKFRARRLSGTGGCPITGPVFCNRDLSDLGLEWTPYTFYFRAPETLTPDNAYLRFGQWEVAGAVAYDEVELAETAPKYTDWVHEQGALYLGEGESLSENKYVFIAPLSGNALNQSKPLVRFNCSFNAPRWVLATDTEVVYQHQAGALRQSAGIVEINVGYYVSGLLSIEASSDDTFWKELGTMSSAGTKSFPLPDELQHAEEIWIRLRGKDQTNASGQTEPASIQVYGYTYRANFDGDAPTLLGKNVFVTTIQEDPKHRISARSMGNALPGANSVFNAIMEADEPFSTAQPTLALTAATGQQQVFQGVCTLMPNVHSAGTPFVYQIEIPYELPGAGSFQVVMGLGTASSWRAEADIEIPHFYEVSYGACLPDSNDNVGLWWASSGWKINQTRPLPKARDTMLRIQAARNETEAAQFVVRPQAPLRAFHVISGDLIGPGGAVIPADRMETLRVRYVSIEQPSDSTSVAAPWPDPLPPFAGPLDLPANLNQPVWVRVHVPRDAASGKYTGHIALAAEGYAAQIPVEVTVFDFVLPDRMTCTTAFGFNPPRAFRYHRAHTPEEQRAVYEMYLATLSAHHIGPYDPAALDPFVVTWPKGDGWQGGIRDRSEKHAGESALYLADTSPVEGVNTRCDERFVIPDKGIRLCFWYKTAVAPHAFLVTINHCGANGEWMPGRNNDIRVEGNGGWQQFQQVITAFPEGAQSFRITLWPALYAEDGATQGAVWFDELRVEDAGTGAILIAHDFEPPAPESLAPEFDWTAWDAAMTRAFDTHHFNGFAVPIPGMGGGTFHERWEPNLLGYGEDTPEYRAMFSAYCQGVQEHLRERGWLQDSYVYWFDEPEPKDYEFVMNGFRKLKENAPGIGRMLTEQIEPDLIGGPNIWCPLTPAFEPALAQQRRAEGDRFWWYVCCGPKAPYVTLFTDHPGTELRVWLWQTWQRRIDGILIWDTNYWTSETAYPDLERPQNPYEDAMSWTVGYGTPPGTKLPWGNGDGRFIYPPEAAANGNPPALVLDQPVDSIRFEMLRDGIEDYEYLAMLDRLIAAHPGPLSAEARAEYAALCGVPAEITDSLTQFTLDPGPIEARREVIARAIETLTRAVPCP